MDGTILDTIQDLTNSLNHVLSQHQLPIFTTEQVASFFGNGAKIAIERACNAIPQNISLETQSTILHEFNSYYPNHCQIETKPFPYILDVLQQFKKKGIQTVCVSNKNDDAVQILSNQYFKDYFAYAIGVKPGIQPKPSPELLLHHMHTNHIDVSNCVYIGDSEVDYYTAQNAKMDCILVDWGFRLREYLETLHPTHLISSPIELLKITTED